MLIYEKPKYIQVVYHPEKNYIVFDWSDFMVTLDEIRELHEKALAAVVQNKCFYYIAETSRVRNVLRQEVVEWFGEFTPKLVQAGIKAIVTVVPSSAVATLSTRSWQEEVVGGIVMKNVKTFAEAETVIMALQQTG